MNKTIVRISVQRRFHFSEHSLVKNVRMIEKSAENGIRKMELIVKLL